MRKIIITLLIGVFFVAGCGGKDIEQTDQTKDVSHDTEVSSVVKLNHLDYRFIIPENSSIWPIGIHVPEGYTVNTDSFDSNGALSVNKDSSYARFQFSLVNFKGHSDAILYFDRVIKDDTMTSSDFILETFDGPIFTPFPGEEDITHSEATFASAMYTRTENEDTEVTGEIWIYWFDVRESETNKAASMGFVLMSESTTTDWEDNKYNLDMIRKSIFFLPSKTEIDAKMERAELDPKTYSKTRFAKEEIELKELQMRKGIMPAPSWKTILNKKVPCYSDKDDSFYLVDYIDTPSGLLPHPTIDGMTVDPNLPDKLFSYLEDEH